MIKTPNIYLIGLGGIGGAYASMAKDQGFDFKIICNEARAKRYSQDGFVINNKSYQFEYFTEPKEQVDLILIAVKANQLLEAVKEIKPYVTDQTIIISLLNGISSERIIEEHIKTGNILHGFTVKTDGQRKKNIIHFTPGGKIVFGPSNPQEIEVALRAENILQFAGVPFEKVDNIIHKQWWKMMTNVGINQTQGLLRVTYAAFEKEPAKNIAILAMKEVLKIANQLNISLSQKDMDDILKMVNNFTPQNKTSMLQDLEARRLTEVDIFAGEVMRLGKQLGIETALLHKKRRQTYGNIYNN